MFCYFKVHHTRIAIHTTLALRDSFSPLLCIQMGPFIALCVGGDGVVPMFTCVSCLACLRSPSPLDPHMQWRDQHITTYNNRGTSALYLCIWIDYKINCIVFIPKYMLSLILHPYLNKSIYFLSQ